MCEVFWLFFVIGAIVAENRLLTLTKDFKRVFKSTLEFKMVYTMHHSNGGVCYNDLNNMTIPEVLNIASHTSDFVGWLDNNG